MDFWQQISTFVTERAGVFVLLALVMGIVSLVMTIALQAKMKSVLRPFSRVKSESQDPAVILPAVLRTVEDAEDAVTAVADRLDRHLKHSSSFFRHVGLVRYDAFDDIGGQQSYSLCLLDGERNGILLTYLTSKNATRAYAVSIEDARAPRKLSAEETRAIEDALSEDKVLQLQ